MDKLGEMLYFRINAEVKEEFRQIATELNPGLPPRNVMSTVLRGLIHKYIIDYREAKK